MLHRVTNSLLALTAASFLAGCVVTVGEGPVEPIQSGHSTRRPSKKSSGTAKPTAKNSGGGSKTSSPKPTTGTHKPADPTASAPPATNPGGRPGTTPTPGREPGREERPAPSPGDASTLPPRIDGEVLFGNGKSGAFRGLVYAIDKNTNQMPPFDRMRPFAMLFRDKFDITPVDYTQGFPGVRHDSEWFAIRYEGVVSLGPGTWRFRLVSDDGAILWVDGKKVVDNDGTHASISKNGETVLTQGGQHQIRLDYFHTTGPVSLSLFVANTAGSGKERILIGDRTRP